MTVTVTETVVVVVYDDGGGRGLFSNFHGIDTSGALHFRLKFVDLFHHSIIYMTPKSTQYYANLYGFEK